MFLLFICFLSHLRLERHLMGGWLWYKSENLLDCMCRWSCWDPNTKWQNHCWIAPVQISGPDNQSKNLVVRWCHEKNWVYYSYINNRYLLEFFCTYSILSYIFASVYVKVHQSVVGSRDTFEWSSSALEEWNKNIIRIDFLGLIKQKWNRFIMPFSSDFLDFEIQFSSPSPQLVLIE